MSRQIVVTGRADPVFVTELARQFGGVAVDLPASLRHPRRRSLVAIPYENPDQMAGVRSFAYGYLQDVRVTLED